MLEDTGERVIPEYMTEDNALWLEHLARYHFALPYAHGRVLDIACGSGYGTKLTIKRRKKEVTEAVGIDLNQETVEYARGSHYHPNVAYRTGDLRDASLPEKLGTFDTVLSFETIEHLPDDREGLARLSDLTKPGGTLIVSTPFGAGREEPCGSPFHYFQLTESEFISLFQEEQFAFSDVRFYYQNGVSFEAEKREGWKYPIGIAVCQKQE
ncbi:class I SAM-dependent methyltransferase [Alkalicoccus halolimnae]|uniref:Class I SAM-dependent methyltransferase n=1 Tax=Alkalicoccus halolimnae TaxID=1667239 RepID=A0A5C7FEN7_9BACI|nr:class I SAM-dependent methyltransferase [Alkalicoccus halolimnae]TXF83936.1 class I SAM-dependent methyltransferase [Alkalicoccus halolimnae]